MPGQRPSFAPIRMLQVEIGAPLPSIEAISTDSGQAYTQALSLVRLHSQPLGLIEIPLGPQGLSRQQYACHIWRVLRREIVDHLHADGLGELDGMDERGIPPCIEARERCKVNAPLATIVIPTRDRPELLNRCLDSITRLNYPAFEVLVVDSAPRTTDTARLIEHRSRDAPSIRYLREERANSAAARNRGLDAARGEIVAFTDDDTMVDPHWLAELVKGFTLAERVACVTGLTVPAQLDTPAQLWFEEYGGFAQGFARRVYDLVAHRSDSPIYPFNAGGFGSGNNMAFRTRTLRSIGGFDPVLGIGTPTRSGEDIEVFARVIGKGHRLVYEPAAIVQHEHRRRYASLRGQLYEYGVGFTAGLTRSLVRDPRVLPRFARRLPACVRYALSPSSPYHAGKGPSYPRELTRINQLGMLVGPWAYLYSLSRASLRAGNPLPKARVSGFGVMAWARGRKRTRR